ncbi:hypothetical protein [Pseudoalteromonas sp. JC3]|uniref:hypothetical protein n=1 Tax=Pseudoalteromonas sp. JC3 TaxID=2810196 RepID=UPI0019CF9645|nr:hypothetical protein [Pseudoalteromonas sp. JC3]MBR8844732.1 hypothetical protein [Pseudoalteromonas sp. JC3]WJE10557.1 hypothetical protein QSH61_08920 [Pseudoalteromonas sp. JC3]
MSLTTGLAVIAILVAILSAHYARKALGETKRSNVIALHSSKKEIYDAFLHLKSHMEQKADGVELTAVSNFYQHYKNSILYFDEALSKDIEIYFKMCFQIADLNRTKITKEKRFELMDQVKVAAKFAVRIEEQLKNSMINK